MKTKWEDTPFSTIEEAHELAGKMGSNPSTIITDAKRKYFQIKEGRKTILVAQSTLGGPVKERVVKVAPPLQDPNVPKFRETDRLLVGSWVRSDHANLEDVQSYWEKQFVNMDNVEILEVRVYRIGGDEYEYVEDPSGIWQRVLSKKK